MIDLTSVTRNSGSGGAEPERAAKTLLEIEQDKTRQLYKKYQENIRQSEIARTEILKALQIGAPLPEILLLALSTIAILTGDTVIRQQAAEDLQAVYGYTFRDHDCLEYAAAEIRQRLQLLERAEKTAPEENKKAIQRAIRAHRDELKKYTL